MKNIKDLLKEGKKGIERRSFLKLAGLSSVGLGLGLPLNTKWAEASSTCFGNGKYKRYWRTDKEGNHYFVQNNLLTGPNSEWPNQETDPFILARYDQMWNAYPVREYDEEFHNWWIEEKNWYYQQLINFFEGITDELEIPNGGHHHPMLATDARMLCNRGDSQFNLNNTPKGLTIIPKVDKIQYIVEKIQAVYDDPNADLPVDLFKLRQELYADKTLWDKTKFATLELYSGRPVDADDPGNQNGHYGIQETHTFQNIMVNPMATLTYMSLHATAGGQDYFEGKPDEIPTFEFRGFCWLISHYNPDLTEYERAMSDYINLAHCGYHGGSCALSTNIFVISEQFNNSPGYDPYGWGKRSVPVPESGLYSYYPQPLGSSASSKLNKPAKLMSKAEKLELLRRRRLLV